MEGLIRSAYSDPLLQIATPSAQLLIQFIAGRFRRDKKDLKVDKRHCERVR